MKQKICHCQNCNCEDFCAAGDWHLFEMFDPCCPNMKAGRKQYKQFVAEYMAARDFIDIKYYE